MQARPRARRPRPRLARVARSRGGPRRGDPPGCLPAVASPRGRRQGAARVLEGLARPVRPRPRRRAVSAGS
eukprot:182464-Pyramimonas_sp.AAC.1